jgi:DNA-binding response OmpR family regulator
MALRQTGIEVQEFQTLSGIPENADTYRLFVVDGDIKPGNAIELSRDLRRQQSTVDAAIVLLSFDEAIDAYDAGVDMVMAKPVSINLFMARIRSILRRYNSFR